MGRFATSHEYARSLVDLAWDGAGRRSLEGLADGYGHGDGPSTRPLAALKPGKGLDSALLRRVLMPLRLPLRH